MKKISVYTREGDQGMTGLVGGTRIKKNDSRIQLYGEVDELNSHIGYAVSLLHEGFDKKFLQRIQSSLFDLGSNLACEKEKRSVFKLPSIKNEFIESIEKEIDKMDNTLMALRSFILPGGCLSAAAFHICRTVSRRVERQMVEYDDENPGEVPDGSIQFMNRLSDYFFVLSRYLNHLNGISEIEWHPDKG